MIWALLRWCSTKRRYIKCTYLYLYCHKAFAYHGSNASCKAWISFKTEFFLTLSLRFNGHFPGEPRLASVYWSKGWWKWWWQLASYKSWKAPVESSPPTNQHPFFYRPDALPVAQPTMSKHWRKIWIWIAYGSNTSCKVESVSKQNSF